MIDEQQERHKSYNNTIAIDHQRDTLTVSIITLMFIKNLKILYFNYNWIIYYQIKKYELLSLYLQKVIYLSIS